jgi:DNA-binding transcriptional ArsR family regulator
MAQPQLDWDCGTAYDLFISLDVLHRPADYAVRGAWAAGVRARLPAGEREVLEQARELVGIPFHWLYNLSPPKDVSAVLWTLGQIPAAERLPTLSLSTVYPPAETAERLKGIATRGNWDEADQEALRDVYCCEEKGKSGLSEEDLATMLGWWARVEEFGERYLEALRAYQDVFFAEEERRIRPALEKALSQAQVLAGRLSLPDLLEELSQGVRFDQPPEAARVVVAPSYWSTPLMYFAGIGPDTKIFLFGARPPDASLVPGEMVPDALLRALKALSDPTRLRILHYLAQESLTPAQLSRRLRLRAPTVTHHLRTLRLAGLVQLTLGEGKDARQYATRYEAVAATCDALKGFLGKSEAHQD